MNIFKHRDSFFGYMDSGITEDSLLSLFRLAKQIKLRLGKKGYLLDSYLSLIFEGMNSKLAYDAADDGFLTSGDFQRLLFHVLDGTEPKEPHPLYQRVREVYEQYADRLIFQEPHTNLLMLRFLLEDELLKYFTTKFVEEKKGELAGVVDVIRQQQLYEQISHAAGESMMEELNQRLKQRFAIAPAAIAFAQGCTDDLLFKLTARDYETSKQMFQLLLDSIPEDMGA